jgi:hypothetical protein
VSANLHNQDFYAWTNEQSRLLRAGQFENVDIVHLIEEVEDMGSSIRRQLESRLEVLLMHLLKWKYQSNLSGKSWLLTIAEQRRRINKLLRKNPSLKSVLDEAFLDSYEDARYSAMLETGLDLATFPEESPFTLAQTMDTEFLPEAKDSL